MAETIPDVKSIVQIWLQEHSALLFAFAYRWTGSSQSAEDIVQSVFVRVVKHFSKVHAAKNVRSYLMMMTRNEAIRYSERNMATMDDLDEFSVDPSDNEVHVENRDCVQQALQRLSEEHRRVLLMYYFEESSYQEIAEGCSIPVGTVMSRLSRAKEALRKTLIELGVDDLVKEVRS